MPETRPLAHQMHAPEFWQRLLWGVRQGGKCWPTKTLVPLAKAALWRAALFDGWKRSSVVRDAACASTWEAAH